jgi:L-asparaginase/Glu-tRNA(Gln) amidotransferase subunit D
MGSSRAPIPPTNSISPLAIFAFMAGCTTTDYLGKTYPPTQHVDVFYSPQDVKRAYEVMGEIRAQGDDIVSYASMQQKLVQEAMQKGADALVIEQLGMTETGSTTFSPPSSSSTANRRTLHMPVAAQLLSTAVHDGREILFIETDPGATVVARAKKI